MGKSQTSLQKNTGNFYKAEKNIKRERGLYPAK